MIKKIILMMLILASSLIASDVNWAKDYDSGMKTALKQNKPVLFVISRDTCKYCIILDDTTLKDEKVVKTLNKDFVAVRSWTNEGDFIPREIAQNTPGLPGIWFLLPNGDPMFQPLLGLVKKDPFLDALAVVKTEFDELQKGKK